MKLILIHIYESMVALCKVNVPHTFIEHVFHINKFDTDFFWSDENRSGEKEIILEEWTFIEQGVYRKRLYNIWFIIKFTYVKV